MKTSKLNLCRLKSHSHPLKKYEFWHDLQCIWTLILGLRQLYEDKNFFLIDIDWLPIDWYHQISVYMCHWLPLQQPCPFFNWHLHPLVDSRPSKPPSGLCRGDHTAVDSYLLSDCFIDSSVSNYWFLLIGQATRQFKILDLLTELIR